MATNFYDLETKNAKFETLKFSELKGKTVLVVNVASKCGYTKQYKGLQKLYNDYKDQGLVILGFPCNQFGSQEPGTEEEIVTFCSSTYSVDFPIMAKIDVNGDNVSPVYKYLKGKSNTSKIKWNFEKFLVDKNGNYVAHHLSGVTPEQLEPEIEKLLA